MQKKWIFLAGIILLVLAAIWMYNLYQQPRENVVTKDAAFSVTADELYNAFKNNEAEASIKYVDKILVVSGTVKEIQETDGHVTVILISNSSNGNINADVDKRNEDEKILAGNKIKLKGRCTGFLSDVYLTDCIIYN